MLTNRIRSEVEKMSVPDHQYNLDRKFPLKSVSVFEPEKS
jgi:hypothetical protein